MQNKLFKTERGYQQIAQSTGRVCLVLCGGSVLGCPMQDASSNVNSVLWRWGDGYDNIGIGRKGLVRMLWCTFGFTVQFLRVFNILQCVKVHGSGRGNGAVLAVCDRWYIYKRSDSSICWYECGQCAWLLRTTRDPSAGVVEHDRRQGRPCSKCQHESAP